MKSMQRGLARCYSGGFSLIELVIVIVVFSIAAIPLLGGFANVARWLDTEQDIPIATQLSQECAEHLMLQRRTNGYASITSTSCDVLPAFAGYTRSLTITSPYTGSACPTGASCKLVAISVAKGGNTVDTNTFMLVDY